MPFQSNRRFLTVCMQLSFKQWDWRDSKQGVVVGESSHFVVCANKMAGRFDREEDFTVQVLMSKCELKVALQFPPCFTVWELVVQSTVLAELGS